MKITQLLRNSIIDVVRGSSVIKMAPNTILPAKNTQHVGKIV